MGAVVFNLEEGQIVGPVVRFQNIAVARKICSEVVTGHFLTGKTLRIESAVILRDDESVEIIISEGEISKWVLAQAKEHWRNNPES